MISLEVGQGKRRKTVSSFIVNAVEYVSTGHPMTMHYVC